MSYKSRYSVLPDINSRPPRYIPCPLFCGAVDEVENNIKAPRGLVIFSALSALSVAIQGLYDVAKPTGQVGPVSLFSLFVGMSGERKSTVEGGFLGVVREFQAEQEVVWVTKINKWKVCEEIWRAKRGEVIKKIAKMTVSGECALALEQALIALEESKPAKPKKFKMLYEDSTSEAFFSGLDEFGSAGIISSENGLSSRVFNDLPKLNAVWSGDAIVIDRKTTESFNLQGSRVTVSFMTQPSALNEYVRKRGDMARGSGLWARFLVCSPESMRGYRPIDNVTMSWESKYLFSERMKSFLVDNYSMMCGSFGSKKIVKLSPKASERWIDVFNEIEVGIRPGGRFEGAGDLASKLADNILRVAALLHVFEGFEGDVSLEVLEFSVDFCLWCSDEFYRVFMPLKDSELDVIALRDWLVKHRKDGMCEISKNKILQYGPRRIRSAAQLSGTLESLECNGEIEMFFEGKTAWVDFSCIGGVF